MKNLCLDHNSSPSNYLLYTSYKDYLFNYGCGMIEISQSKDMGQGFENTFVLHVLFLNKSFPSLRCHLECFF